MYLYTNLDVFVYKFINLYTKLLNLYTKSDQLYNINQPNGDPLPATCIPTESQQKSFFDGDIVEFIFKKTGNPNKNLFVPLRTRNEKEANSLSTIMSTMCVIRNPFTLDMRPFLVRRKESKKNLMLSYSVTLCLK